MVPAELLWLNTFKRMTWKVSPTNGIVGIMADILRDTNHKQNTQWWGFYNHSQYYNGQFQRNDISVIRPVTYSFGVYTGVTGFNYTLTTQLVSSQHGWVTVKVSCLLPSVRKWIQLICQAVTNTYPHLLKVKCVDAGPTRLAVQISIRRWCPELITDTPWCVWERYQSQNIPFSLNSLPLTNPDWGTITINIKLNQLLTDIWAAPTDNLRDLVIYCRRHNYDGVTHHLDHTTLARATSQYQRWKCQLKWHRYQQIITWIELFKHQRLSWNHHPEEGTCGVSWWVHQFFSLPSEIHRLIIQWV